MLRLARSQQLRSLRPSLAVLRSAPLLLETIPGAETFALEAQCSIKHRTVDDGQNGATIPWLWKLQSRSLASSSGETSSSADRAEKDAACPNHECHRGEDDGLFCADCGALMPSRGGQTYFTILGMAEGEFKINDTLLDRRYKDLQRQLHPDKFSTKSDLERERSEEASALVNEAFSTLKSPLKRAEYILKQKGIDAGEGTIMDEELLMGVMEAREAVEATQSEEELQKFSATFQHQAESCIEGLVDAFAAGNLEQAQELTTLLRYVTRIQTAILEKQ